MKIAEHFKAHATVHFCWAIAVLTAIIIGILSAKLGTNDNIKDILTFAVSLASLVLALVAIVQALVSSGALSSIVGTIQSALDKIDQPAKEVSDAAKLLATYSERIDVRAEEIGRRLSSANAEQTIQISETSGGPKAKDRSELLSRTTRGGRVAYYACVRSFETSKLVDFRKMFPDLVWSEYAQGFVIALRSTATMDVEMGKNKNNEFRITDLKELSWLTHEKEALLRNVSNKRIAALDDYFDVSNEE